MGSRMAYPFPGLRFATAGFWVVAMPFAVMAAASLVSPSSRGTCTSASMAARSARWSLTPGAKSKPAAAGSIKSKQSATEWVAPLHRAHPHSRESSGFCRVASPHCRQQKPGSAGHVEIAFLAICFSCVLMRHMFLGLSFVLADFRGRRDLDIRRSDGWCQLAHYLVSAGPGGMTP